MNSRNEATSETCPRHIWMHSVVCEVAAAGLLVDAIELKGELRPRMNAAYNAGEPVWMVVDEMKLRLHQKSLRNWEDDMRRALSMALRSGGGR